MRTFMLSLGIALAVLTTNADAQVALRKSGRAHTKHSAAKKANYYKSSREHVERVGYDDGYGDDYGYGDGVYADDGCSGGCGSGGLLSKCGKCNMTRCGCALGTKTYLPYPRCFNFFSPCVTDGCTTNPCCGTIFSEMWCDVQNWFAGMSAVPSAACVNACPQPPFGFRGCCGGGCGAGFGGGFGGFHGFAGGFGGGCGMSMPCLQDLLLPKCVDSCGSCSSCKKPSMLQGFGGMLMRNVGCTTSCGGGCGGGYDDGYGGGYDDAYYDGEEGYYDSGAAAGCESGNCPADSSAQRHRYYATTRPGSNRTEYVTASEYSRIEMRRAEDAEMIARGQAEEEEQRQRAAASRPGKSQSARRPTKPQARNEPDRRSKSRSVDRVSFEEATPALRLNRPELNELEAEVTPYVEFLDREYRD